jgi:hypothetical protein
MKCIVFIVTCALIILSGNQLYASNSQKQNNRKETQLCSDLDKVWPFAQTVKVEYELVLAQLEIMDNDSAKKVFLTDYENYVKDAYFDKVVRLNIRQGKLLLLLIHRELKRTPYELLKEFRNKERADFWQKFALLLGADLKEQFSPKKHHDIETLIHHYEQNHPPRFVMPR